MPFVIISGERFALEYGETVLGGHGDRALEAEPLAHLAPFAVIEYPSDAPSTIRPLGKKSVTLNGAPLGAEPEMLQHLDRIEVDGLVLVYGEMRMVERSARPTGGDTQKTTLVPMVVHAYGEPTASTGGRLIRLADASVHHVPEGGLTIGRDPSSAIVLDSKEVSRKHVSISSSLLGYTITDHSYRGVWVNGTRIEGSHLLGQRDTIRVGGENFRFEADVAKFEPTWRSEDDVTTAAGRAGGKARHLASLEVVSDGPLKGQRFRVARPTVQIGRSKFNDVQLPDDTVSARHASLVRRGNNWIIFDVRSLNGTFVEGQVVRDHRVLPNVCELQLGTLKLLFHATSGSEPKTPTPSAISKVPTRR
jgi:pSer/pThr/pTyr-binding forkhead associated (FHA) protein